MIPGATEGAAVAVVRSAGGADGPRATGTDGRLVYAVGDVHGRYDLLVALLEAIARDAEALAPGERPLLVFLGDYVDRGPRSAEVVTTVIWLSRNSPMETVFLRGNHEAMMLTFLERPEVARPWLRFGGAATLRSYGVDVPEDDEAGDEVDCERLRDEFLDRMPASHLQFLRGLPTRAVCGDYVFVHAGLRPGVRLAKQSDEDCMWIREDFLGRDRKFEKVVVHGHTWASDEPVVTPNRIGIDTGAYRTGALTAVRLGGPTVEFLQARAGQAAVEEAAVGEAGAQDLRAAE